jgi:intracellular septation protein A
MKELMHSARYLAEYLASMILFVVVLEFSHNTLLAVGCGMVLGVAQIAWHMARKEKIDAMQWMSVALVIAGGTATFITNDPRFVMIKPSVIHVILGVFMLQKGWMVRYLPQIAQDTVPDIADIFGFVWAGLMLFTAGLNVVVALTYDALTWGKIMSLFGIASIVGLFLVQFACMRFIARRRVARGQVILSPASVA